MRLISKGKMGEETAQACAMASLEKSRNSLQTGVGAEPLFMLRCDRSPVMLTWFRQSSKT